MLKLPQLSAIEHTMNSTKTEIHFMMKYFLCLFLCFGCVSQQSKKQTPQGAYGLVTEIIGNQMPSPDLPKAISAGQAVEATIHFYAPISMNELRLNEHGLYTPLSGLTPIAICRTDRSGKFRQQLAAGSYSVVVVLKDGWFAHQSDGNIVQPVQIDTGKWTAKNIQLNYRAAY
jgi:hypothetical protein